MDEQRSNTDILGNRLHTGYRILEQGRAELVASGASIDSEPCKHHHRRRIGHVAPDCAGGLPVRDGARCQSVIPKHALVGIDHDEGAAGPV